MVVMNTLLVQVQIKTTPSINPFFPFFWKTREERILKPNQTKPNQAKPSQSTLIKPYLTKQTPQPSPRTVIKSSRMT